LILGPAVGCVKSEFGFDTPPGHRYPVAPSLTTEGRTRNLGERPSAHRRLAAAVVPQDESYKEVRSLAAPSSVLVVDPMEETREVLRTILERRGVRIFATRRADEGLRLARQHHPDVIVLDTEARATDPASASAELDLEARRHDTPLVLLGGDPRDGDPRDGDPRDGDRPANHCMAKPYHYGRLIRKIEELLAQRRAVSRAA
jgi:CheY-like chemotaxis protein